MKAKEQVKFEDTSPITCDKCNSDVFVQGVFLRKVSKFLTGATDDGLIPIQTFTCAICGNVNDGLRPK